MTRISVSDGSRPTDGRHRALLDGYLIGTIATPFLGWPQPDTKVDGRTVTRYVARTWYPSHGR